MPESAGTVTVALPSRPVPAVFSYRFKPRKPELDSSAEGLKFQEVRADFAGVNVDNRLLNYWQREQGARRRARAALPARWRNDPRPEMRQVVDTYVELLAAERQQNVVPLVLEDH